MNTRWGRLSLLLLSLAAGSHAAAAVTSSLSAGTLAASSDAGDPIAITCAGGNVLINGNDPDSGAAACPEVTSLVVTGGNLANVIDLGAVDATNFPNLEDSTINALGGDDDIFGSYVADRIDAGLGVDEIVGNEGDDLVIGGDGNDVFFGGDGDDVFTWNPGDDNDEFEGGAGNDLGLIVGGGAAETFPIAPSPLDPAAVRLQRTDPAPFFVDIRDTETLRVEGNDGDDTIDGSGLPVGMIALELFGGEGNDTLTGSDAADTLEGAPATICWTATTIPSAAPTRCAVAMATTPWSGIPARTMTTTSAGPATTSA
jgi:Ca2+-binding RTX toxin-like protein